MKKELTPLETLKTLKDFVLSYTKNGLDRRLVVGCCDDIEAALNELEEYKSILKDFHLENPRNLIDNLNIIKDSNFHKKLKALEIIKEKGIDTETFYQFETYEDYQEFCENSETFRNLYGHYTQEEYELLKEVLK